MINSNPKKINEVLSTGVDQILPSKEGLKRIMGKKRITVYLGIDPTSPKLHLGHTIPLIKLRQFQELGHKTVLLFGTFTAQIGDPSGKDKRRKVLSTAQIKENIKTYKKQASKIIDFSKGEIRYNADWLSKFRLKDLLLLASYFTTTRLLERDMFQKRLKEKKEVWVNELLYPLMQGYDSVAMDVDLEIGGTDQTFNMLIGRKLQKIYNKKEKFVLTLPLLTGSDGRKMSKSYNNKISLTDKPEEMYGKIMSLKDEIIPHYFELCLGMSLLKVKKIEKDIRFKKVNPRDLKSKLAKEIVKTYHGLKSAEKAEQNFKAIFKDKGFPSKIKKVKIKEKKLGLLDLLDRTGEIKSRSMAKRLILQKGIKIDNILKEDWREVVSIKKGAIIKIGKRRFVKIV